MSRTFRFRFLLLPIVVFALASDTAVAQDVGITPTHVAQTETVTSVAIAPDAGHVAYTLAVPADPMTENAPSTMHLYVVDTQTRSTTALYTTSSVGGVAFRPQQGTVTFLAVVEEGEPRGLYEVPTAGGEPTLLFRHERPIIGYEWSPDGQRIAFMAFDDVPPPATDLPYQPEFYEENLAQRLAFVHDLRTGTTQPIQYDGSYYMLSWSPNGDRLAVSAAPTPMVDDMYMYQQVMIADPVTGSITARIDNEGKIGQITWSPDGQRLALRAGDHINDPIDGRIMVVPATGGIPANVLPGFEGKFEQLDWTADDTIHFIASESVERSFGTIRPDGTGMERVVDVEALNLAQFSRSADGSVAFAATTPRHPSEVYLLRPGAATPERITNSNAWLDDVPLGEQRVVSYTARDGAFDIDGLLILPLDYEEGMRVPLIVMVHGGPEAHYSNGWLTAYSIPGQMAAARGFAVFYPNYRGSTGRGLEFIMSSQADLSGREFDDIVDGVDYLIEQGIVDPDQVGVTGGSYGGYATAWMSTYYSDRFAAGVMFVGISNNLSKWGTSDIPDELYLVHSRERMWETDEKWMDYLRRSPIYHVENAQTPLLIMHGAEDTRVHPGQSLELYRHMVVRRPEVPVRLILYPGEGHGNVRSASRFDYTLRMLEWFETYLVGDGEMPSLDLTSPQLHQPLGSN